MNLYKIVINIIMFSILIYCIITASDYMLSHDVPRGLLILYGQLTIVFAHVWGKFINFLEDIK